MIVTIYKESNPVFHRERCFWDINSSGACLIKNIDKGNYEYCIVWPKVKILGMVQKFGKDIA